MTKHYCPHCGEPIEQAQAEFFICPNILCSSNRNGYTAQSIHVLHTVDEDEPKPKQIPRKKETIK